MRKYHYTKKENEKNKEYYKEFKKQIQKDKEYYKDKEFQENEDNKSSLPIIFDLFGVFTIIAGIFIGGWFANIQEDISFSVIAIWIGSFMSAMFWFGFAKIIKLLEENKRNIQKLGR